MYKIISGLKQPFIAILGALMCLYILIPLSTAIFLGFSLTIPDEVFVFAASILETLAIALSAFITSLVVNWFAKEFEVRTTVFMVLVALVLFVLFRMEALVISQVDQSRWIGHWLLKLVFQTTVFIAAAFGGVWVVTARRNKKNTKR